MQKLKNETKLFHHLKLLSRMSASESEEISDKLLTKPVVAKMEIHGNYDNFITFKY